jgi:hypothetical protein
VTAPEILAAPIAKKRVSGIQKNKSAGTILTGRSVQSLMPK